MESRRHEDAHPLPGAGRLGEADGLSQQRPRLGGAPVQRLRHQSQPARPPDRLPDQRRQLAHQGGELQRRRRQHHHVHGALSAPASQRLPGEDARRRGRRLADRLPDPGAVLRRERPHDRRLGPGGRPRLSAQAAAHAADPARQVGPALRQGDEPAGLALVAVGYVHRHGRLRGPRPLPQSRPLHAGLRPGRQGQHRHHLLAGGAAGRRRVAHPGPRARDHRRQGRHGDRRRLLRRRRQGAVPAGRDGDHRLQRRRHAAADAEFAVGQVPQRHRQFERAGRQEPDVPPLCLHLRLCRRAAGRQSRPAALPVEP